MSGEYPSLKMLETRRLLLVAEAEVHRAQLHHELEAIQSHVRLLKEEALSVTSVMFRVMNVLSAFGALRQSSRNGNSSLVSKVFRGARFASTVWQTFRSRQG